MDKHIVYWTSKYKTAVHFQNLGFVRCSDKDHVTVMPISDSENVLTKHISL